MSDFVSAEARSLIMSKVKSKGNLTTEMRMVEAFRRLGVVGWRRHLKVGNSRPDFVFRREKIAVFLDGCFWHSCPLHGSLPRSNRAFWESKFKSNSERDLRNCEELKSLGWNFVRFWEHSIKSQPDKCATDVLLLLSFSESLSRVPGD